ncbi:hypothetical protein SH1V18_48460 [Vallitalea longa]|uniref:YgjP-like metallopeptidase domain-containing protein n=1 Tax=Vallitalea longa TaxID=2936439 RepID=A0A9W5YGF5_9FIRM|nr:SprT family zinc-dependent metalloprotease [Vallitalea longa]GKX32366.1 hypothetical protein SH1V18_48460 [Vallitalea longa]
MRLEIKYGTKVIEFSVEYRDRKTLEISVEAPNTVNVVAPLGTQEEVIKKKVHKKASWIVQRLYEFRDIEYRKINREYVSGESFMYLGRNYSLELIVDENTKSNEVKLYQGKIYIISNTKSEAVLEKLMESWYRNKTLIKVTECVEYYKCMFNIQPSNIKVKEQKKRWASCTSKNELLFNWRCVMAPSDVLDYIVVHEMCHMMYPNHSIDFWNMLESILPDYKNRKAWLKKFGVRMDL